MNPNSSVLPSQGHSSRVTNNKASCLPRGRKVSQSIPLRSGSITPAIQRTSGYSLLTGKPFLGNIKSSDLESYIRKVFADKPITISAPAKRKLFNFNKLTPKKRKLKAAQVEALKAELIQCCLTHIQDSYRVHLNRLRGLQILDTLTHRSPVSRITPEVAMHMVWSCLSCIHHFLLRLKSEHGVLQWLRRKQARRAMEVYDELLQFLEPMHYPTVFSAVLTFLEEANLWDVEYFCSTLLKRVLQYTDEKQRTESLLEILSLIENSTLTNTLTSRQILEVFFDMQQSLKWVWMNDIMLDKVLEMYYHSVTPEEMDEYSYDSLEKGLEACVRAMSAFCKEKELMFMIRWMLEMITLERIDDENLLNFGSLLEHITTQYCVKADKRPIPEEVIPSIIQLIGSENLLYSLLGNRILHNLTDRCNNKLQFAAPRIFFRDSRYNLVLNNFHSVDKALFQRYRELLHKTFVESVLKHGVHKIHLEHIYVSIALFLVEIPCGYTAAAAVCLAMSIQEAALNSKHIQITHAHRLHATVVSIMSLVCYIHKADIFYDYVETIIDRRSNVAPHLNPPLNMKYYYAQHHILWNKPDLFFEDWETRYGLWKCFKDRRKDIEVVHL